MKKICVLFLIVLGGVVACSPAVQETAETPEPIAQATEIPPTNTATAEPEPTATLMPDPTNTPAPTATPSPNPTETPMPTPTLSVETFDSAVQELALAAEEPVILHESTGKYINPGAIILHDGVYHMFANGFSAWPAKTRLLYYTSTDRLTWTPAAEEPIFRSDDVPFAELASLALTGFVEDDGTWVLYFHTFSNRNAPGLIGRMTALAPEGPWTADPEPVLIPGSEGAWDDAQVMRVNVFRNAAGGEDAYVMFYAGVNQAQESRIGRATSADGINWEKYDDPATTDAPYAESDPILEPTLEWERSWLGRPEVVQTAEGWVMLYEGDFAKTGLAFSEDGINWVRNISNPVLTRDDIQNKYPTFQGELYFEDGEYFFYVESGNGARFTDVYLWTFQDPIR